MKKYQLMAPGPTPVPSEVLLAMAQPIIHHRTPEYEALFADPGGAQAVGEGERARVLLVSNDVTALRESEERLLLAAHALEGMTEAIMITAADGTVVTVNRAFTEITGYTRDDVLGQSEQAFRTALQPAAFYDELYLIVQREGHWSGTTWSRRKNGSVYREWRSVRAVRDPSGMVTHYVHVFYEVNAAKGGSGAAAVPPA